MPASFLFEEYSGKGSHLRDCRSESKKHDDLLMAFTQHERLVLLGEPGTGKTFSLWRIAAEQARKTLADPSGLLPVIIPLNRWTDESQTLQDFVLKQMGGLAGRFDELRRTKRLLPLLDALNEIPFDQRTTKLKQVKEFVNQPEPNDKPDFKHLLLTCRKRDYVDKLEQDMDRLTIDPLDPPRIHQFLHNYFAYFEQQRSGEFETGMAEKLFWQLAGGEFVKQAWERWQQQGKGTYWHDFWELKEIPENWGSEIRWLDRKRKQQLDDPRSLLKLAANPYLLFLITTLYARYRELPRSRIDLFGRFVKVLLEREEVEKAKSREYIPKREEMLQELKQLAWQLQSRTKSAQEVRTVLSRSDAVVIMPLTRLEFAAAASLLELTRDSVRFSHQLLQEFFTAQSFEEQRANGLQAKTLWPEQWWVANGWEEAAKLAAEYEADPKPFLQWLAAGQPLLAYEIAKKQGLLSGELFSIFRDRWRKVITDIGNYPNPHERHAISTLLAKFGWDNRPYIGLNIEGLPDIDWVEIPAGEFTYQNGEHLSLPSYNMSRYPVTNAQFQAFITAQDGYNNDRWWRCLKKPDTTHESYWKENNRPVEQVNWYEAMAFCSWLKYKTGLDIRLPNEHEWEKAARGSNGRKYPWEGSYKAGYANVDEKWKQGGVFYLQETSAVGIYPQAQSSYGLMDMAGNVWEWCLNKYEEPQMITADLSGSDRVFRGGAWNYHADSCSSFSRYTWRPSYRGYAQGFRLLCCSPLDH